MFEIGLVIGLAAYVLFTLYRSSFRVEEGYLGVKVAFGKAELVGPPKERRVKTYPPGIHFKLPWERIVHVSMKEQTLDLNDEEGGGSAMADDGTILRLDSFVRYVPVKQELYAFLFALERPLKHITGLFTCLLRNEIANFGRREAPSPSGALSQRFDFAQQAGSYALIRRERKLLNDRIESFCRERINERYGVHFNAVDLADILPPDELADALNAVMQARSEAETRVHRGEAECQQRILAAERGLAIASARGEAIEAEIRKLASFLDELDESGVLPAYVARRRAEVMGESRTLFMKETA
jgi:regulator of protease activity HflC (stomatin/prohibitin superfamily)